MNNINTNISVINNINVTNININNVINNINIIIIKVNNIINIIINIILIIFISLQNHSFCSVKR